MSRTIRFALVFVVVATTAAFAALTFPPLTGRVVDAANILSASTREQITSILAADEQKTGEQIVVATLASLQGTSIEDLGYQLGRAWGIGQKGKDNGAILIVVPSARQVRIEVGYGLEDKLTDAMSRRIIEGVILPHFRQGDFDGGVRDGVVAMIRVLGGDVSQLPQEPRRQRQRESGGFPIELILIVLFFVFVGGRGIFWPLLFLGGLGGRRGGHYGGGFGGGGGSGGGFSGGGGSFGGGGASGSW